ncbi:hypothetical protein OnM2_067059 [Erysiphe neolycopersici]|uniref:Retrotransposon gag domain-containing protein n=1 Tax=Erysiphe neolycopersici TaxID=212602 RepID=A0A420HLW5_9PEZI|nr:hypothetical protein OnM2_067059 [Erysiphe neolycopersici]
MPANPRDTLTGRLMAQLPEEEQERIWIRRLEGIAAAAKKKSEEFRASFKNRQARRSNQAEFMKELRHPTDVEQQKEDEAMTNTLDLTEQENITLQRRIDELSIKSFAENKINPDPDSDEEFFRELTPKRVHFFKYSTANIKSPTPASICGIQGSYSCPSKNDTFNGTRKKYEELIDREDRKLNYLMQHLTGPAYDLVKDDSGPRARALDPNLTLEYAIKQLDRAYFPVDKYRTARAKLEKLKMGYNESFAEFNPKFHIQINRLKLGDKHKVDELTKRLSKRFADKFSLGQTNHTIKWSIVAIN